MPSHQGETVRLSIHDLHPIRPLSEAQDRRCGICTGRVAPLGDLLDNDANRPTLDHVWPRNPRAADLRQLRRLNARRGTLGNAVMSHARCNCSKGNRLPNGCELLWLMVANARAGTRDAWAWSTPAPPLPSRYRGEGYG